MIMTVQRSAHVQDRFLFDVKKHVDIFDVVMTAGLREVVNNAWKARKSANEGVSLMCTISTTVKEAPKVINQRHMVC